MIHRHMDHNNDGRITVKEFLSAAHTAHSASEMPLLHEHQVLKRKIVALLAAVDDESGGGDGVAEEHAFSDEELVAVYDVNGPNGLLKLLTELNLLSRLHGDDGQDKRPPADVLMSLDISGHGQITLAQLLGVISHLEDLQPPSSSSPAPSRGRDRRMSVMQVAIQGSSTTDGMMAMGSSGGDNGSSGDNSSPAAGTGDESVNVQMRPKKDPGTMDMAFSPLKRRSSVTDVDGMAVAQLRRQGSLKQASQLRVTQENRTTASQKQFQRHSQELEQRQMEVMREANAMQTAANNAARIANNRREARERWKEVVLPMPWDV